MKTQRSILPLFSGSAPNTNPLLDPNISTAYTELSPNLAMATLLTDIVDSANLFDAQGLPITITSLNGIAGINNFTNTLTYWENITISPLPSASNFTILGMVYIDGTNVNFLAEYSGIVKNEKYNIHKTKSHNNKSCLLFLNFL